MSRFEFGRNWANYATRITDVQIAEAITSFQAFSSVQTLQSLSFLDIGCGSGIHSLAAYRLEASRIVSFDRDALSTQTCHQLKEAHAANAQKWSILEGDILDSAFLSHLGTFDYVYAWGVLHHTGHLWTAIRNAAQTVSSKGRLHLALYNRHWTSPIWKFVKRLYCQSPSPIQEGMLGLYAAWEQSKYWIRHGKKWPARMNDRGMFRPNDLRDWLGGYPYDYCSTQDVLDFLVPKGFRCVHLTPNSGTGCSEFLFERIS